ncbi:MAG: hypothetical protein GC160_05785 [Acidobacteria bacterium]|nr:hypothetical protein [Acidobacteriota bacterium]
MEDGRRGPDSGAPSPVLAKLNPVKRLVLAFLLACLPSLSQPTPRIGSPELEQTLDKLNVLGSALMMAAHPDDENTAVISYLARGRLLRTGYLSATRGEGGQNLIGPEQGALMGLIRTQELLAARSIDGGEQFFTRSIDFGYSKFPEEALAQWGRQQLLADMVRVIRQFRPDVIIARFPPPPGDGGHGQHTAVGHLGPVAYEAAADPKQFPELGPAWRAKRYVWNVFQFGRPRDQDLQPNPNRVREELGEYNPVLGKSYAEIAGESRSMHRSQAMGTSERKGSVPALFDHVAGERAEQGLLDGIDLTWGRIDGGERVGVHLAKARDEYDPRHPEKIVPHLLDAWEELEGLQGYWPDVKRPELLHAIELASGLWIDATADRWDAVPGGKLTVEATVLNRSSAKVVFQGLSVPHAAAGSEQAPLVENEPLTIRRELTIPADAAYTQPPWLALEPTGTTYRYKDESLIGRADKPPALEATIRLAVDGRPLTFTKPVVYRWVDPARGERVRSLEIVPAVAVAFTRDTRIFPNAEPRSVPVVLTSNLDSAEGTLRIVAPPGWKVEPASQPVKLTAKGQAATFEVRTTPPSDASSGELRAEVELSDGRQIATGMRAIEYEHIPIQMIYSDAKLHVERIDVRLLSKKIGYVMGAGDNIPEALQELGADVTLLGSAELAAGDLTQYDAIVAGVRALNTREDLLAAEKRIHEYIHQGGTFVMQYNVFERRGPNPTLGPYRLEPQQMTRDRIDRIVDENAPVRFVNPDHPLLTAPNHISQADFEGWVQERGLYFMGSWDERYLPAIESADEGQPQQAGSLLMARYGKGVYVFTGLSFFRQLPAGVPGAYRLFANIVSAGK